METSPELLDRILNLNVADIIVRKDLEEKLKSGKKLRVKYGVDPSGPYLTIGHMVPIRKLREFQEAGHQIIILIGNFTAQIGDPTGKAEARKVKSKEEVTKNASSYLQQFSKVLDIDSCEIVWNADWFEKFTFEDVLNLSSNFTVAQMLERDMFQERIKQDKPIGLHEFMYPLMQGYDSVELRADVEVGATEQTFNMLAGRILQKAAGQTPQNIVTVPILTGTDGVKKMGKSEGNFIAVLDEPQEMFGKVMSIPDKIIENYFELCTNYTRTQLDEVSNRLKSGENPRDLKMELATNIVKTYHSEDLANQAKQEFINVFSKGQLPDDINVVTIQNTPQNLVTLMVEYDLAASKSEARRLIEAGGVKINQEKVTTANYQIDTDQEILVQVGKRKFIKFKSS